MIAKRSGLVLLSFLALPLFAAAQTIQGTVTNGTTGKPAGGAEVTLISLGQGMTETAHTKSDSSGHFQLSFTDSGMPHLVRVTHQNTNYFRMAPPGVASVDVPIYDVAKKLDGISTTAQVLRVQSDGSNLQMVEIFAVQNSSSPPRTLAEDHSYEFALPEGAVIDESGARAPGGQPINSPADTISGKKDHYAFNFPLRPGETQFQVVFHLPYGGSQAVIKAPVLQDAQHFVAVLPLSMQFSASGTSFAPMAEDKTANVQIAGNVKAGETIAMTVSGTGALADNNGGGGGQGPEQASMGGGGGMSGGPGGGLGKPIDSPDPLSQYRWPLLGGLAAVLVAGGVYIVRTRPVAATAGPPGGAIEREAPAPAKTRTTPVAAPVARPAPVSPAPARASSGILEALKDELFQLEIERQQGRISEEEYQQAKAALDTTLRRAIARTG